MPGMAEHTIAIQNLKARYCLGADLSPEDAAGARLVFDEILTDDVVGDYGMGELIGREALTDFLVTAIAANSEWMIHMLHSPLIDIDGERAKGQWTVLVKTQRRGGAVETVFGRYEDEFILTPAGWKIVRVRADLKR